MIDNDERIRDAIIERATHWYLRHRDGDLTPAESEEFLMWLRASLQHTSEYLAIARLSSSLRGAIVDLNLDQAHLLGQMRQDDVNGVVKWDPCIASRSKRRKVSQTYKRAGLIGLAAAVFVGICASYWLTAPGFAGLPRAIAVMHGEQRTVQLSDGSVVHINASSRLVVRFSDEQRLVELDQGQALFEVAHNPSRPFRVRAGSAEVTAVGTQFDVYRRGSRDVTVTVVQGKVDVVDRDMPTPLLPSGASLSPSAPLHLGAGEQVQLGSLARSVKAQSVDVREATAWVRREVTFEGRPLRDVTQEFNRYVAKPIEIEDPALNDLQVSGVFNAYDADSFVVFLRQYDVQVKEDADAIHVGRREQH